MTTYQSKFDLGQTAVGIIDVEVRRIVKCEICRNTGKVTIRAEEFECPQCRGKASHPQYAGRRWMRSSMGTGVVASIQIEHRDSTRWADYKELTIRYMLNNSMGGQLWDEANLFPTREEADTECDRRNAGKNFADEV